MSKRQFPLQPEKTQKYVFLNPQLRTLSSLWHGPRPDEGLLIPPLPTTKMLLLGDIGLESFLRQWWGTVVTHFNFLNSPKIRSVLRSRALWRQGRVGSWGAQGSSKFDSYPVCPINQSNLLPPPYRNMTVPQWVWTQKLESYLQTVCFIFYELISNYFDENQGLKAEMQPPEEYPAF